LAKENRQILLVFKAHREEKNPSKVSAKTTPNSATMAGTRKETLDRKICEKTSRSRPLQSTYLLQNAPIL
jgi:hypothetical protein